LVFSFATRFFLFLFPDSFCLFHRIRITTLLLPYSRLKDQESRWFWERTRLACKFSPPRRNASSPGMRRSPAIQKKSVMAKASPRRPLPEIIHSLISRSPPGSNGTPSIHASAWHQARDRI